MLLKRITVGVFIALAAFALFVWAAVPSIPQIDAVPLPMSSDPSVHGYGGTTDDLIEIEKANSRAFKVPPISAEQDGYNELYRLVLMPSFNQPIMIQASRSSDDFQLVTKLLRRKGGNEIGYLDTTERRVLTTGEWQTMLRMVDRSEFWWKDTFDPNDGPVVDGATWMIEARRDGAYHTTFRITPRGEYLELCKFFLQMAGREHDYDGYYESP